MSFLLNCRIFAGWQIIPAWRSSSPWRPSRSSACTWRRASQRQTKWGGRRLGVACRVLPRHVEDEIPAKELAAQSRGPTAVELLQDRLPPGGGRASLGALRVHPQREGAEVGPELADGVHVQREQAILLDAIRKATIWSNPAHNRRKRRANCKSRRMVTLHLINHRCRNEQQRDVRLPLRSGCKRESAAAPLRSHRNDSEQ